MDKDNVKGTLEKIGGKLKEVAGELTGNEKLKDEGKLDQVKGAATDSWGNAKEAGRDLGDSAKKSVQ